MKFPCDIFKANVCFSWEGKQIFFIIKKKKINFGICLLGWAIFFIILFFLFFPISLFYFFWL